MDSPDVQPLVDTVIPVRLDAMFDYGCARADASDVRFVDAKGVVMAHEIDEWMPEVGGVAWVRIPVLDPRGESLWLYYGNPTARAEPAEVWPQDLGYQAVLHFAGDLDDARGMHPGEPAELGEEPLYVEDGVLGRAVHYEHRLVDARAEIVGSEQIDDAIIASHSLTITAWIRSTPDVASFGPYRAVVSRGSEFFSLTVFDTGGSYDFLPPSYAAFPSRCQAMECAGIVDASGNQFVVGTVPVIEYPVIPVWHHVAAVYADLGGGEFSKRLYVDGELDAEFNGPLPLSWSTMAAHGEDLTVGAGPLNSEESVFYGELDEVHIASQAWGAERIRAEQAFADQASLVMVGSTECR